MGRKPKKAKTDSNNNKLKYQVSCYIHNVRKTEDYETLEEALVHAGYLKSISDSLLRTSYVPIVVKEIE